MFLFLITFNEQIALFINDRAHLTSSGQDSVYIRVKMLIDGLNELIQNYAVLTGFGFGASNSFLSAQYGFGSFHNVYIDILFETGIIGLCIYIYCIYVSIKNILKIKNEILKNVLLSGITSYCIYSLFESGSMLFDTRFHSLLTTVLFVIIPRAVLIENENSVESNAIMKIKFVKNN